MQVSEEVYREYKRAEDKEHYFMKRLKRGRFVVDDKNQTVTYVPGRETSYEQLLEAEWAFAAYLFINNQYSRQCAKVKLA